MSAVLTLATRFLAIKFGILDAPDTERRFHGRQVPLLGGTAIFLSFWAVMAYLVFATDLIGQNLAPEKLVWVFLGGLGLIIIGAVDDKYRISYGVRLAVCAAVVLTVIAGGVSVDKITNPFGGIWYIDMIRIGVVPVLAFGLVFAWIMGMIFTAKILDGLDGLTSGIAGIASLFIFLIANGERWHQSDVALTALILAGAIFGFLIFNFYPARIFLGEGGGLWLGFMLGVLSVIAGGKFAVALLVMAVPILDLAWVLIDRLRRRVAISVGDRSHLHFRLIDAGLSHRHTVLLYYFISVMLGAAALFLQSIGKAVVLLIWFVFFFLFEYFFNKKGRLVNGR